MATPTRYQDFEEAMICELAWATDNQGGGAFNLTLLAESRDYTFELGWIERLLSSFTSAGLVAIKKTDDNNEPLVEITPAGRAAAAQAIKKQQPPEFRPTKRAPSYIPRSSFRNVVISREQFFDLMIIAMTEPNADGTDEAPWDIELVAKRQGFLYEPAWIEEFCSTMESYTKSIITVDSKTGSYPESSLCAYTNDAAYQAAPLLAEKYYGELRFDEEGEQVLGRGVLAPASDRLVALDHNSTEYQDAVANLGELLSEIERSNSYFEKDAETNEKILAELKAGRTLIEAKFVERHLVHRLLLSPLTYLITAFAGGAIAALATDAYEAIKALVGLL